jgi:hypothetical protein
MSVATPAPPREPAAEPTAAPPAPVVPAETGPTPWPITVPMFGEMVRLGVIGEKEPVFLWKGALARSMAPNPHHSVVLGLITDRLRPLLPANAHLREDQPLAFRSQHSQPEPDVAIVRGVRKDYLTGHPTTGDTLLVVEVADSSLPVVRTFANDLAAEGVPVNWIVNLPEDCVEVYTEPAAGVYRQKRTYTRGESVPVVLDGAEAGSIAVADVLP